MGDPKYAPSMTKYDLSTVFISYSDSDRLLAERIAASVERENMRVWHWTRDMDHSVPHPEQTFARIDEAEVFLCIVSRQTLSTDFVFPEILRAASQHKTFVIVLNDLTYSELERQKPRWCQAFGFSPAIEWHSEQEGTAVRKIVRALRQATDRAAARIPARQRGPQRAERSETDRKSDSLRQYYMLGATLSTLAYQRLMKSSDLAASATAATMVLELADKLPLSGIVKTDIETFARGTQGAKPETLPDFRNRLALAMNVGIAPSAATAFYLGFNVICLSMTCRAAVGASGNELHAACRAADSLLSEIVRDAERLTLPTDRLRAFGNSTASTNPNFLGELDGALWEFGAQAEQRLATVL